MQVLFACSPSPSLLAQCHLAPLSVAYATSSPDRGKSVKVRGFGSPHKVYGFAKGSPFGRAVEQSETERARPFLITLPCAFPQSPPPFCPAAKRRFPRPSPPCGWCGAAGAGSGWQPSRPRHPVPHRPPSPAASRKNCSFRVSSSKLLSVKRSGLRRYYFQ